MRKLIEASMFKMFPFKIEACFYRKFLCQQWAVQPSHSYPRQLIHGCRYFPKDNEEISSEKYPCKCVCVFLVNSASLYSGYTPRNLFEILLHQTEIRFYSPFTDWYGTANGHVRLLFQINRKMVNTI